MATPTLRLEGWELEKLLKMVNALDGSLGWFRGEVLVENVRVTVEFDEEAGEHFITQIEPV